MKEAPGPSVSEEIADIFTDYNIDKEAFPTSIFMQENAFENVCGLGLIALNGFIIPEWIYISHILPHK